MRRFKSLINVILVATALAGSAWASGAETVAGGASANNDTTFYEVSLECPAAPQIACGGRSKPVLFALERRAAVAEASVNRSGTRVAVTWKAGSTASSRKAAIDDVASLHDLSFRELGKEERHDVEHDFAARAGWYRSADTGQLSEDESHFIAERLVRRLVAQAPTAASKAESLTARLFDVIKQDLVDGTGQSNSNVNEASLQDRLLSAARDLLNATEFDAFKSALQRGYHPVGNES